MKVRFFGTAPVLIALLAGCAPSAPTPSQAQKAMVTRMEQTAAQKVEVTGVNAFALGRCRPPEQGAGLLCDVTMDVSFRLDGEVQRSEDAQPMRFVRENGRWVAYPG